MLSIHSMTGHDLYLMGLMQCNVIPDHIQFMHTFIVCKNTWKELVVGLDMQHLYHLGCDWPESHHKFLHQGAQVFINSIVTVAVESNLRTIYNIDIPGHSIITIPTGRICTGT